MRSDHSIFRPSGSNSNKWKKRESTDITAHKNKNGFQSTCSYTNSKLKLPNNKHKWSSQSNHMTATSIGQSMPKYTMNKMRLFLKCDSQRPKQKSVPNFLFFL